MNFLTVEIMTHAVSPPGDLTMQEVSFTSHYMLITN